MKMVGKFLNFKETMNIDQNHEFIFCDLCRAKKAVDAMELTYIEYKGVSEELWFRFKLCYNCGCDYSGKEESQYNKEVIKEFKRMVDESLNHKSNV